jgi:hypothetical protein
MATANFDGGSSASVTASWTGNGGVDSSGANGVDLPTTGNLAFNGNKPVYVTTARFFVAGRGASRSIRVAIGGQYSGYVTVSSSGSAVARDFTLNKVFQNGGADLQTRIDENGTGGFYFGRGADGTGSSIDDNGSTWSGSLSGYATYFYVPTAPTSPSAVQDGLNDKVNLSWSAPSSDGGSAVTGYVIHYSTSSTFASYETIQTGSPATSYQVTGLNYGQTYYFRVMAVNAAATAAGTTSVASSTVSAFVLLPGTDGWENFGTLPANNTADLDNVPFSPLGVPNTGLRRIITATATGGSYTIGNFGIQRTLTGLNPGSTYKVNAKAVLGTAGMQGNIYRLAVVGKTAGSNLTLTTTPASFSEYTFSATSDTHVLQMQLAESYTVSPTGKVEDVYLYDLTVTKEYDDLTVSKGYWIQDNLVAGSLADHYKLTMDSIGGYWWVDRNNKTQFSQERIYQVPVGTFTDGYEDVGGVLTPGQSLPGELHYNTIEAGFDTTSIVNDIVVTNEGLSPYDGNETLPTAWQTSWNQKNDASIDEWRNRKAELRTNLWLDSLDNSITNPSGEVAGYYGFRETSTTNSKTRRVKYTREGLSAPAVAGTKGEYTFVQKCQVAVTSIGTIFNFYDNGILIPIESSVAYTAITYQRRISGTNTDQQAYTTIRWYDKDEDFISQSNGPTTTFGAGAWVKTSVFATAPATAVYAAVQTFILRSGGGNLSVNARWTVDAIGFYKGDQRTAVTYFDGDFVDTNGYIYDWLGSKQESASRRSVNKLYTRASDILTDYADPELTIKEFEWNAVENPLVAAKMDVGSLLYLKFNGVEDLYRIAGLSHDITPEEWLVKVRIQKASI